MERRYEKEEQAHYVTDGDVRIRFLAGKWVRGRYEVLAGGEWMSLGVAKIHGRVEDKYEQAEELLRAVDVPALAKREAGMVRGELRRLEEERKRLDDRLLALTSIGAER